MFWEPASTVTEMVASDVLMRSTETLFLLKISNTCIRKPATLIILVEKILITNMLLLLETDFTPSSMKLLWRIAVPFPEGFMEFRT